MYLGSFLKSLFTPRKFLSALYFLLNLALIFILFGLLGIFSFGTSYDEYLNGAVGIGIHFIILLISLSPVGEAVSRFQMRATVMQDERCLAIFNEVYERARAQDKKIGTHVRLYRLANSEVNAFALGHRTIILLDGLANCDDAYIRAVLAHEFGHIANGDSDLTLGIRAANGILCIFIFLYTLVVTLLSCLIGIFSQSFANMFQAVLLWIVNAVYAAWTGIGFLMNNASSRRQEYAADAFAVACGYGKPLYDFLSALEPSARKVSLISLMCSTHPDTARRLKAIREKMTEAV